MNQMQQMKDPAAGIPRELLPHLHLISKNRYPVNNNPSLDNIVAYLLEAPKVVRESQPVQWQILDCPQDGTLFLTWQPPELGVNFASDGYVWADQEVPFNSDVRGYTLQMLMHKSGFRPQAETMACHTRRRYRLLPTQQNMGGAMPDPSLWLIHYAKAAHRDQVAAAAVPVAPTVHAQLQQRRVIIGAGALARKEFMLHDRTNWPTINLPGNLARHAPAGVPVAHRRGQSLTGHEPTIEEEEDVSRGDVLDFMTPRDISRIRYEQHHEWMEEILESPFRTMQIIPPDLGIGRKGELESLTKDFFDAPTGALPEPGTDAVVPRVGRLDRGKAAEFTTLANQRLADMQLELEKMKRRHQLRMDKLRRGTHLSVAEKKLRSAPSEKTQRKSVNGGSHLDPNESDPIDEIVKEVEGATGRKVDRVKSVTCVARGGLQEVQIPKIAATPSQPQSTIAATKPNINMTPTPMQQQQASPQQTRPDPEQAARNTVTQGESIARTQDVVQAKASTPEEEKYQATPDNEDPLSGIVADDIDMAELDTDQPEDENGMVETNDWVMVDDTNMGDNMDSPTLDNMAKSMNNDDEDDQPDDQTPLNTGFTPVDSANQTPLANTQHNTLVTEQHQNDHTPLDTGDFDFDDVNTAGDALADYGADDDDLNLDNMDDSAFGDAFHATEENDLS